MFITVEGLEGKITVVTRGLMFNPKGCNGFFTLSAF